MKNWFKKKEKKGKKPERKFHMSLFGTTKLADWKILIFSFLILNIGVAIASYLLFEGINSEELFQVEKRDDVQIATISREDLDVTVSFYREKLVEREELLKNKPKIKDPAR